MNRFIIFFQFYKLFISWSIIVNVLISSLNPNYTAAIITKFFLVIFAWYFMSETTNKRQFTFYKNLGISPIALFAFTFMIDCVFTLAFLFLVITFI